MKSARRPGSVMFEASACRSSDINGDSDTICWKFALMLRCSASISRRSSSLRTSGASVTRPRRYGTRRGDLVEPHARQALDDDAQAAVGQLEHLVNLAGGADRMQIGLRRLVFAGFALREHGNGLAARHRLVNQLDRALARHRQRHERLRKQHGVAQRQHRHFRRHAERGRLGAAGVERFDWVAHVCRPSWGEVGTNCLTTSSEPEAGIHRPRRRRSL